MRTLSLENRRSDIALAIVQARLSAFVAALSQSYRRSLAIRVDEQRARIERMGIAGLI